MRALFSSSSRLLTYRFEFNLCSLNLPTPHQGTIFLNVCNRAVLVQRADRKPVTAVTIAVAKENIICWTAGYYATTGVVDGVIFEQ